MTVPASERLRALAGEAPESTDRGAYARLWLGDNAPDLAVGWAEALDFIRDNTQCAGWMFGSPRFDSSLCSEEKRCPRCAILARAGSVVERGTA